MRKEYLKIALVTMATVILSIVLMAWLVSPSFGSCTPKSGDRVSCLTADANPTGVKIGTLRENIDAPYAQYVLNPSGTWAQTNAAGSGTGTVTSVTAGNGMTQTGTASIDPTLNIVSHTGSAGTIGTINVGADAIGVNLGSTSTTAAAGNHGHTAVAILPAMTGKTLQHLRVNAGETDAEWSPDTDFNPAGAAGGQTIVGGTAAGENLTLSSTSNGTKGKINLGANSTYDEVNTRLGIGTAAPAEAVHSVTTVAGVNRLFRVDNPTIQTVFGIAGGGTTFGQGSLTNHPALFYTNSVERMRIGSTGGLAVGYLSPDAGSGNLTVSGKVGIGNSAPTDILNVDTSVSGNQGIRVHNTSAAAVSTAAVFVQADTAAYGQLYKASSGYTGWHAIGANDLGFFNTTSGNIVLQNDTATGDIRFAAGGSSTPQLTLSSTGSATFTGAVTAQKFNSVDITGAATPTLAVTGTTTVSGANTGDNATNTTYASDYRAANFVAGTNYEAALGNPGTNGYVLSSTTGGTRSWVAPGAGGMVYPGSGVAVSTGAAWGTSLNITAISDSTSTTSSTTAASSTAVKSAYDLANGKVGTDTTVNGKALSSNITLGLSSADFANQGTTSTVLHGNAAGNPAFGAVALGDIATIATKTYLGNTTAGTAVPTAVSVATLKSDLSLNNVENTALSTWTGNTAITSTGTIATGTWNATAIADGKIASALTGKTYNGHTLTAGSSTFTGTAGQTYTFPTTTKTLMANDYSNASGSAGSAAALANTGAVTTNSAFYPMLSAANTTSNQASSTATAFSYNPSTGILSVPATTTTGAEVSTPGAVTCSHTGAAIPLTAKIIELTSDGDSDQDNCTLAAGTAGQELELVWKAQGNTNDGLIITPSAAFVDGATTYAFSPATTGISSKGKGINLVYGSAGWHITATNNPDTTSTPAADGTAARGTSQYAARADHVHPSGSAVGAVYKVATSNVTTSSTTAANVTGLTWSIAANQEMTFDCNLNTLNTATSLLRFNVNGPASPTAVSVGYSYRSTAYATEVITGAGAFSATATSTSVTSSVLTTPILFNISGTIKNGSTAGTVAVMASASTAGQTGTIYTGSSCYVY